MYAGFAAANVGPCAPTAAGWTIDLGDCKGSNNQNEPPMVVANKIRYMGCRFSENGGIANDYVMTHIQFNGPYPTGELTGVTCCRLVIT